MSPSLSDAFRPSSCIFKVPPCHFIWYDAFFVSQKIAGGLRGRTGFISQIISRWAAILWKGKIFHDLSELNFGFGHFRRDFLEVFQVDAAGYWVNISGVHDLVVGNAM